MKKYTIYILIFFMSCAPAPDEKEKSFGPLRVSELNTRYFTDDRGDAIYLTGSHTWNNLVDIKTADSLPDFDYTASMKWMKKSNFNFFRLWAWELINWDTRKNEVDHPHLLTVYQNRWARTGPDNALDGKPKFDLTKFNDAYFKRLTNRIEIAREHGIYVSIMLFEGWGLQFAPKAYENHPFHPDNNINGIAGDVDGDGKGIEIHALVNSDVLAIQEAYVKKVIDLVNKYDNILYEISNESHGSSTDWQYHMINFINEYQQNLPNQHLVGMTFQPRGGGSNQYLFDSPADWISPNPEGGYKYNPPVGDGRKVIITDTDHLWGLGGNGSWVWKSFFRGLNPIFMDSDNGSVLSLATLDSAKAQSIYKSMGYSRLMANRIDLISMLPDTVLTSSMHSLVNKGKEYLIYLDEDKTVEVDLSGVAGEFTSEWFNTDNGEFSKGETITGGDIRSMISPYDSANVVLHLLKN